jgi:putative MATE family efflux protein
MSAASFLIGGMFMDAIGTDLTKGHVTKQLVTFAVPFMLSNALQALYSMVDTLIVGNVVGETGISAVTNASMLVMLMTTLCMGFSNSGQVYIAQLVGASRKRELNDAIGTLFTTMFLLAGFMTAVSIILCDALLNLLDVQPGAYAGARDYMLICGGGIAFTYGYNMISAVLRGMGESKRPLLFIAIASVVNLVLDLLFVAGFHWGVAGAAWATIIGQGVSFFVSIVYLYRRRTAFGFDFRPASFKIRKPAFLVLVRLGIPFAIQMSAINISMLFVNRLINSFGGLSCSAAFGVSTKVQQIPDIVSRSIGMASSSMIGQNLAAGEIGRAKKVVYAGLWMCVGIYVAVVSVLLLFPREIFSFFTRDENVLQYARACIIAFAISSPAFMLMPSFNAFIQGLGNAIFSLAVALTDGVVARVTLSWLLGVVLGASFFGKTLGMGALGPAFGFFLGYNLAAYVTAIPSAVYVLSERWRKRALLI